MKPLIRAIQIFVLLTVTLLMPAQLNAAVRVIADSRVDTYLLFQEGLGGIPNEVPDCGHSDFGPHITQQHDSELRKDVFAFHLHAGEDNDRCMVYDRQRTEVYTYRSKALRDETRVYRWRFKLSDDYLPSTFWNHIFQIRPIDSVPGGNPIFTFSLLSGETEELLFYRDVGDGMKILHRAPLAEFKGKWIDAQVTAQFSPSGSIDVQLKSTLDDVLLLEWTRDNINLWPHEDVHYTLPKWGNYRSLIGEGPLRDEIVLYDDFCVAKEGESCDSLTDNVPWPGIIDDDSGNFGHYPVQPLGPINPFPLDWRREPNHMLLLLMQAFLAGDHSGREHTSDMRPETEIGSINNNRTGHSTRTGTPASRYHSMKDLREVFSYRKKANE